MAIKNQCCSIPAGRFYAGAWGGASQVALAMGTYYPQLTLITNEDLGHLDSAELKYTLNQKKLANKTSRAGGTACTAQWVESCMLDMKVRCQRASNLAIALLGKNNFIATGAVTNEDHIVKKNPTNAVQTPGSTFMPFNRIPDTTQSITVTGPGGTPTYVLGTDYTVGESGILIPASSSIPDAASPYNTANVRVSYTALDTLRTDGLVYTPQDLAIFCDGFDRSSGGVIQTHIYRAKGMADGISLLADDFITLSMTFEVLEDDRIPINVASPTSRYFHQLRG